MARHRPKGASHCDGQPDHAQQDTISADMATLGIVGGIGPESTVVERMQTDRGIDALAVLAPV
jgi:hypothetical protein